MKSIFLEEPSKFILLSYPCKECIVRPICFSEQKGFDDLVFTCSILQSWRLTFFETYKRTYLDCTCPTCLALKFLRLEREYPKGLI
jgi:hypothetical protein